MAKGKTKGKTAGKSKKQRSFFGKLFVFIGKALLFLFIASILLTVLYRWVNPPVTPLMVIRKVTIGAPIEKEWKDLDE